MALGESAIRTSPSLSYVHLRSLLPTRLSSLPVVSSPSIFFCFTRFFCLPLFICYSHFRWIWIYRKHYFLGSDYLLLAPSICVSVSFCGLRVSFTVLFGGYFLCLVLLLLGSVSAKSHPHVQLIRAELSSKSSSEPLSESLSKLSSHQIPRCLGSEGPLQLKGCTRSSTLFFSTTPSGASVLQVHSALWHSTSASGLNRRGPPPRGLPPRCPSRAFPSSSVSSSTLSLYEAFPHSEVRRLWALFQSGPLSLLSWVRGLSCGSLCATGISSGADGCFSRLRLTSPSAIAFSIPSLLWMCSAVSQCTGAVGRVSRPRSSTSTFSLSCIYSISLFSCMRFTCNSSRFSLFLSFKWRGQAFDLCRPSGFCCTAELDWTSWPVAFLRPMHRIPAGLVVLAVSDSADFKLTLRRACLDG